MPVSGTRVYVGGLVPHVRERDIVRFFKNYGDLRDILIKNGYGFVEFEDHRDAEDAIYEMNGKDLMGQRVTVEPARGTSRRYDDYGSRWARPSGGPGRSRYGPPMRTDHRIIVENLSSRVSWQDLKDYMRQVGEVTYADAHKNKNEGVVEFASYSDMKHALEKLDDTELNGRRIKLIDDSRGGGGGRRSRSRGRRRSRSRSRSRTRSYTRSRSRSRSRSRGKSRSRSRSRSRSGDRKQRKSHDSRSPSRDKTDTRKDGSREEVNGADEHRSPANSHHQADKQHNGAGKSSRSPSRSKSRSRSRSKSRSRSRSASKHSDEEKARSRSRSRSRSAARSVDNGHRSAAEEDDHHNDDHQPQQQQQRQDDEPME